VQVDLKRSKIVVTKNSDPKRASIRKKSENEHANAIRLNHKYVGKIETQKLGELTVLFDTGYSASAISHKVVDPTKYATKKVALSGTIIPVCSICIPIFPFRSPIEQSW